MGTIIKNSSKGFVVCLTIIVLAVSNIPTNLDVVHASEEKMPFTWEDSTYGVVNENVIANKLVLEKDAEMILPDKYMDSGFCFVKKDTTYYLISTKGCVAVFHDEMPIVGKKNFFNENRTRQFHPSIYSIRDPQTGKYGVLNATTGVYYDYQLDTDAMPADVTGMPIIQKNGKYGVLKSDGELLYEPIYTGIASISNYGCLGDKGNGTYAILSQNGKSPQNQYYYVTRRNSTSLVPFHCIDDPYVYGIVTLKTGNSIGGFSGCYNASVQDDCGIVSYQKDDKTYGFIYVGSDGTVWDSADKIGSSAQCVQYNQDGLVADVSDTKNDLVMDTKGNILRKCNCVEETFDSNTKNDYVIGVYNNLLLWRDIGDTGLNNYFTNKEGQKLFEFSSPSTGKIFNGKHDKYLLLKDADGYFIFDTEKGVCILENLNGPSGSLSISENRNWVQVWPFTNKPDTYGIVNLETGKFSGFVYKDGVVNAYNEGNDRAIFVNNDMHNDPVVVNAEFENYDLPKGWKLLVDNHLNLIIQSGEYPNQKIQIMNYAGEMIADFDTTWSYDYYESVYRSYDWQNHQYGLVNSSGKLLLDPLYNKIGECQNGLSCVFPEENGSELYIINDNSDIIIHQNYGISENHNGSNHICNAPKDGTIFLKSDTQENVYYCYDFSNVMDIGQEKESFTTTHKLITEDELFGEYSNFLINKSYNKMTQTLQGDMAEVLSARSEGENRLSVLKSNMKSGGVTSCLRALLCSATGKYYKENELEQKIALNYLQLLGKNSQIVGDTMSALSEEFKWTKRMYELISKGYKNADEKKEFISALAKGSMDEKKIKDLVTIVDNNWSKIDYIFKTAGYVVNGAKVVTVMLEAKLVNKKLTDGLLALINPKSSLYKGLEQVKKIQENDTNILVITQFVKDIAKFLQKKGLSGIDALLIKSSKFEQLGISGAFAIAKIAYALAAELIPVADSDQVVTAIIDIANQSTLYDAICNKFIDIKNNYKGNGKIPIQTLKKEYKLLYNAYFQSLISGVEDVGKVAVNDKQKNTLLKAYKTYQSRLTYDKYIKSCLKNANMVWIYEKKKNKATIIGCQDSSDKVAMTRMAPEYDTYCLDIPDQVDGCEVEAIGQNAFSTQTNLSCVTLPDSIKSIGDSAFSNCETLETVFLGEGVSSIGDCAFEDCTAMKELKLPASVTSIESNAFVGINGFTLLATENSVACAFAQEHENIEVEPRNVEVTGIKIKTKPVKLTYHMSELEEGTKETQTMGCVDSSGLVITVTYEDGSRKEISEGIYCVFEEKKLGACTIVVNYEGLTDTYPVTVVKDKCNYRVSYINEAGKTIADDMTGTAMAGDTISLPIPTIKGYTPERTTQEELIGAENEFVVWYQSNSKPDLKNATISGIASSYTYTGSRIMPKIVVTYAGKQLKENTDYSIDYGENTKVGKGSILIAAQGDYQGYVWKTFEIKTPPPVKKEVKVTKIKLSGISNQIAYGAKIKLTNKVYPNNATNKTLKWSSSNTKYATVSSTGMVTLKKAGKGNYVTITAKTVDGSKKKATYKIKIMKGAVKKITLKSSKSIKAGKKGKIKATVKTSTSSSCVNKKLNWNSSNTKYATVSSDGTVTTKKAGRRKKVTIATMATDGSNKNSHITIKIT